MESPFDSVIPLLGICVKDLKAAYYSDTDTSVFIAAQFTIAKLWNQLKCSSTDEWIKKLCYIYRMDYYSAINKNDFMTIVSKWMDLETLMLSEISQSQKTKGQINLFF